MLKDMVVTASVPPSTIRRPGKFRNVAIDPPSAIAAITSASPPNRPNTVAPSNRVRRGVAWTSAISAMEPALRFLSLDDFGHGDAEAVVDHHDFAARDQAIVDVDVDGLADLAIEL